MSNGFSYFVSIFQILSIGDVERIMEDTQAGIEHQQVGGVFFENF